MAPSARPLRGWRSIVLLFAAAALQFFPVRCSRSGSPSPDVLLITLDTFRADRIGVLTPSLSRLGTDGTRFLAADSPVPLTLPAHCSLLSGLLPLHHGVRNNGAAPFPASRPTLATLLSKAGYRTGAFVGSFVLDHRFGLTGGFDRYDDAIERDAGDHADSFEAERRGDRVVDSALAWMRQNEAKRPSFTWVHLYDAHAPYAPPAPYPQTYDGEIAWVDAQVGRLLAAVDRSKTLVVVVGDHGESLGEHGELTHGLLLYEPTLHVPLLVSGPGIPHGARLKTPVSTVDLAPTIAALAGIRFPDSIDGRDLSVALRDGREPESRSLIAETQYPTALGWSALSALRLGDVKLIAGPSPELFDLARDPGETRSIVDTSRRSFRDLSDRLDAVRKTAVADASHSVDDETRRKLASLGYIAPAAPSSTRSQRDPRAMVGVFRRYEEALWAIHRGESRAAVAVLSQLVAEDPGNQLFRMTLGQALRSSGDPTGALVHYREAVALAPSSGDAWYNLAAALQEAGQTREATAAIEEASRLDPGRPEVHNIRGILAAERGQPAAAESEFRAVLAEDGRNARAWSNLGNVLRATGRDAEAEQAYRTAIQFAPRAADAWNGLGVILVQRGESGQAIACFDAALEAAPDLYEARLNRAIARQVGGDVPGAVAELKELLRRLPSTSTWDSQRNAADLLLKRINQRSPRS